MSGTWITTIKRCLILALIPTFLQADISSRLNMSSQDGTVNTYPYKAKFDNGTITDNGDGTVSISGASPTTYIQNISNPYSTTQTGNASISGIYNTQSTYDVAGNEALRAAGSSWCVGSTGLPSNKYPSSSVFIGNNTASNLTFGYSDVHIGASAGLHTTSGRDNVLIGYQAGGGCSDDNDNTYIGYSAGYLSAHASYNTAVGSVALGNGAGGSNNAVFGYSAGEYITTGYDDTLLGTAAGADMTTGVTNTCIGANANGAGNGQACSSIVSGSSNTAVGAGALGNISQTNTNSGNTFIGFNNGSAGNYTNVIALGINALTSNATLSNQAYIGAFTGGTYEVNVNMSSATVHSITADSGYMQLASKTVSQLGAITPSAVGQHYYCSDCATVPVCISTGTNKGAFSIVTNKTSACQ